MPKRKKFSGDSLCKLEENGFIPVRQRGSHRILQKILPTGTTTVPVPIHKDLKPGRWPRLLGKANLIARYSVAGRERGLTHSHI
jgi:predicted RNA binding protein YcfA (HicA-like mRNA interferase family)